MKPAKSTAGTSVWFFFSQLKQHFPDKESFSAKAFWQFIRECSWFTDLMATKNLRPLIPLELMSPKDFWAWVKEREWALRILTRVKQQDGVISLESLKNLLPAEFCQENKKCCWEIFALALELFIWQWSAETQGAFQIKTDSPVKLNHQPVMVKNLQVSGEVAKQLEQYCQVHKTTLEDLFHRIVEYESLKAEVAKIGISDGIFQELLKQFGGLLIGRAVLEVIERYCQDHDCTMPELFSQEDCKNPLLRANEIGIVPASYLRLVKFFQGTLRPERVLN